MHWIRIVSLLALTSITACTTTPGTAPDEPDDTLSLAVQQPPAARLEKYTFTLEKQPLGLAIREVVRITSANLVLMNGLENFPLGTLDVESGDIDTILGLLAEQVGFKIQKNASYYFLYAPDYEPLTQVHLGTTMVAKWANMTTTSSFGADTPLFNVFALLGRSLDTTIVGDNAVADSGCGEIHLRDVSLTEALEAALKSARVQQFNFRLQATEDYLFFSSPGNRQRRQFTTPATESGADAVLSKRCDIQLLLVDTGDGKLEGQLGSSRLEKVLPKFSRQLGLPVTAEPAMNKLPVNPIILEGVTRKTALELLIRQWLLPEFGYEYVDGGIRLRYLGPER